MRGACSGKERKESEVVRDCAPMGMVDGMASSRLLTHLLHQLIEPGPSQQTSVDSIQQRH